MIELNAKQNDNNYIVLKAIEQCASKNIVTGKSLYSATTDIADWIGENFRPIPIGSLHFRLDVLENKGFINSIQRAGDEKRNFYPKRLCFLTTQGIAELRRKEKEMMYHNANWNKPDRSNNPKKDDAIYFWAFLLTAIGIAMIAFSQC